VSIVKGATVAQVELDHDSLVVHVTGADRIFALKSVLTIPLEHVLGAAKDEEEAHSWYHGIRAPGTNIPGVITAGTFHQHGESVFWDVHHPERAIAISLRDESYGKLVVEVDDPDATVLAIEAAVGARKIAEGR
jgi:hypothetical protein